MPLSSVLVAATGSWHSVFIVASAMNAVAALMAWFVLRPMRKKHIETANREVAASELTAAAYVPQPAKALSEPKVGVGGRVLEPSIER